MKGSGRPSEITTPATGTLGYLAKMFPRISETFILKEVLALRREGVPVRIYSTLPPTRDRLMHPEARRLLPEVRVLPPVAWARAIEFLRLLAGIYRRQPAATAREISRLLLPPRPRRFRRLWRSVFLIEWLRRDRVAHLHAAWAHTPASIARTVSRLSGIPWSMGAHAKDIHLSKPESLTKKLCAARFTLTCTRSNLKLLSGLHPPLPIPDGIASKVTLHYHGVNTEYFSPGANGGSRGKVRILSVGRLVPKKGFEVLLDAAARLMRQGLAFRLEIVGEGALRPRLERRIAALGLRDQVLLTGMRTREEVRDRYRAADIMVLASRITSRGDRDGVPNTLAEAMACGVPVVASRLPSIAELVVDRVNGLLVPPEDPQALAEALRTLAVNPARRRAYGQQARRRVLESFPAARWEQETVARLRRALDIERVLYVSADRGVPVRGHKGASVHVRSVVKALASRDIRCVILAARTGPGDGPSVSAPTIHAATPGRVKRLVRRLAGSPPLEKALLRLTDNLFLYRRAREITRLWHPDVIYERYALNAIAGSLLARRLRVPHLLEVNAPLADEEGRFRGLRLTWLTHRLERWILNRADRLIVVSAELRRHAVGLGVPAERILVLPNAVDRDRFHPRSDPEAAREGSGLGIGFSGTLKPWHGLHHLLDAIASGGDALADARLLVVGDGPERPALERRAARLGIAGRIRFVGAVPHDRVAEYLRGCDVLVAPYGPMNDFWFSPLKVAEYRALGRPVVASRIGQLAEHLDEQQGVVLVPPGDVRALTAALTRLVTDPAHRTHLARAAAAAPVWTWKDLVGHVLRSAEGARRQAWRWHHA